MAHNHESLSNFSEKQAKQKCSAAVGSSEQVSLTNNVFSVKGMQSSPGAENGSSEYSEALYLHLQ